MRISGAYQQQIGAHGGNLIEHRLLRAVADREHGDHRGDADDDAQQRQERAQQVDP
jgi:hypothetical protein